MLQFNVMKCFAFAGGKARAHDWLIRKRHSKRSDLFSFPSFIVSLSLSFCLFSFRRSFMAFQAHLLLSRTIALNLERELPDSTYSSCKYTRFIYIPFISPFPFVRKRSWAWMKREKLFRPYVFFCHAPETAVDTLFQVVKAPIFVSTSDTHAVKISKFFVLAFKLFFRKFRYNPVACSVCTKKKSSTMNIKPKETRSQNEDETKNEIHSFRVWIIQLSHLWAKLHKFTLVFPFLRSYRHPHCLINFPVENSSSCLNGDELVIECSIDYESTT